MWGLEGRTAIVTGAAYGIGRATADALASAGANVVLADIEKDALIEASRQVEEGGGSALPITADVSDSSSVEALVAETSRRFGSIDILFANAAVQLVRPAGDTTDAEWDRIQDVNIRGVFLCCRAVLPVMLARTRGSIVIAASGHAFATYPGFSAYAAAKGAAVAFMRALALDYAARGVRANCVIPGATDTRLIRDYFASSANPEETERRLIDSIPMRRLAAPEDIARAVLFLASDHSAYITGTCLAVDGGLLAQA